MWRSLGIADRQMNSEDRARLHSAAIQASKMTGGKEPTNDLEDDQEWKKFVAASGLMIGQALPEVVNQIMALQPSCSATKNFVELNGLQSAVENSVFMGMVNNFVPRFKLTLLISSEVSRLIPVFYDGKDGKTSVGSRPSPTVRPNSPQI